MFALPAKIWRMSFWMRLWGGESPKRTITWSNNKQIKVLATRKLAESDRKGCTVTTDRYIDKNNKVRYKGNGFLKKSQTEPKLSQLITLINMVSWYFNMVSQL